jgi:predicted transcriptional regulator
MNKQILMSIKTESTNKILNGTKVWEFRKQPPKVESDKVNKVIIYSSRNDKAIVGEFEIEKIISTDLINLLKIVGEKVDHDTVQSFREYYGEREKCCAIKIRNVNKYKKAITLKEIKEIDRNFTIPQNFRYINEDGLIYRKIKEAMK